MIVAIASGKGGTGKTTVAVNLARVLGSGVQLVDCDVEEPNAHLFLDAVRVKSTPVAIPVPQVDAARCDGCGECSRFCAYHAIACTGAEPLVFPELCHGCGGCALICPRQAINEVDRRLGVIETLRAGSITLIQGRLDVGTAQATPLINAARRCVDRDRQVILDAPPGTACPVIATLRGVDRVILVTEPTPFGLHDLELAVATVRALDLPCGVVVNRCGIGDDRAHAFCRREGIPVLLDIPDDRRIAEAYSRGEAIVDALPEYRESFRHLAAQALAPPTRAPGTAAALPTQREWHA